MNLRKPQTVPDALRLASGAGVKRAVGDALTEGGDYIRGHFEQAEAADMEAAASNFLDPRSHAMNVNGPLLVKPGNGGELLMVTREMRASIPGVVDACAKAPTC